MPKSINKKSKTSLHLFKIMFSVALLLNYKNDYKTITLVKTTLIILNFNFDVCYWQ